MKKNLILAVCFTLLVGATAMAGSFENRDGLCGNFYCVDVEDDYVQDFDFIVAFGLIDPSEDKLDPFALDVYKLVGITDPNHVNETTPSILLNNYAVYSISMDEGWGYAILVAIGTSGNTIPWMLVEQTISSDKMFLPGSLTDIVAWDFDNEEYSTIKIFELAPHKNGTGNFNHAWVQYKPGDQWGNCDDYLEAGDMEGYISCICDEEPDNDLCEGGGQAPEPGSILLLGTGVVGLGLVARRKLTKK